MVNCNELTAKRVLAKELYMSKTQTDRGIFIRQGENLCKISKSPHE